MGSIPTPRLPLKECGTPDAVYGARVTPHFIRLDVSLPEPLCEPDDQALIKELHQAMLPVIERLYERRWDLMAGRKDARGMFYPATYADLWPRGS